jgi:hypothetical protein
VAVSVGFSGVCEGVALDSRMAATVGAVVAVWDAVSETSSVGDGDGVIRASTVGVGGSGLKLQAVSTALNKISTSAVRRNVVGISAIPLLGLPR